MRNFIASPVLYETISAARPRRHVGSFSFSDIRLEV